MNPSSHQTRVIAGERFEYVKTIRKRGGVKSYLYKNERGQPAYFHPTYYPKATPKGTHTRHPLLLVLSVLAMIFHR